MGTPAQLTFKCRFPACVLGARVRAAMTLRKRQMLGPRSVSVEFLLFSTQHEPHLRLPPGGPPKVPPPPDSPPGEKPCYHVPRCWAAAHTGPKCASQERHTHLESNGVVGTVMVGSWATRRGPACLPLWPADHRYMATTLPPCWNTGVQPTRLQSGLDGGRPARGHITEIDGDLQPVTRLPARGSWRPPVYF